MKKTLIWTTMTALLMLGLPAHAGLSGGWVCYLTQAGANPPQPNLQVECDVNLTGGLYTYSYIFTVGTGIGSTFTPTTGNPVTSFTIDTAYAIPGTATSTIGSTSITFGDNDVVWNFAGPDFPDTGEVSFLSHWSPDLGDASANDGVWSTLGVGASKVLVPQPFLPEAPTVSSAALMLIPLAAGAVRALWKRRFF